MVHEKLGASPQALGHRHNGGLELVLADLLHTAARHLDYVHEQFTGTARRAASTLTRAASGNTSINSLGVLQNSGTQIDILAARRADALDRLKEVISAYQLVTAAMSHSRSATRPRAAPAPEPTTTLPPPVTTANRSHHH
ncbi:hypothetical protein ABZV77_05650 [Streptomyces sp. NPDC004732]|uniref:hypothetical protein n=1 Tax=Streptomyces sp. NPDC004732 TaxID=3154290 RepID=UPI00339F5B29